MSTDTAQLQQDRLERLRKTRQEGGTLTASEQADLTLAGKQAARPQPEPEPQVVRGREEAFAIAGQPVTEEVFREQRVITEAPQPQRIELQEERKQRIQTEAAEVQKAAYETVKRLHPLPPEEEVLRDKDQAIRDLWNEQAQAIATAFPDLAPGKPPGLAAPQEGFARETFDAFRQKLIEIEASPDAASQFTDDLLQMGQTPDTALILDMMGIQGGLAQEFWAQARPWEIVGQEMVDLVFPGQELQDVIDLMVSDPEADVSQDFLNEMRKGPATDEKRELLRHLGFTQADVEGVLRFERMVVPLGGIRTLITVDSNTGRAFDLSNRQVGSYNALTGELDVLPEEAAWKDVGDSLRVSVTNLWHGGKQAILNYLPEVIDVLIPDMKVAPGTDLGISLFVSGMNAYVKGLKDNFRAEYARNAEQHQTWFEQHPELQQRKEWEVDEWQIGLLADPAYWANEFAKTVPYTLATLAVQGGVTLATGNPFAGFVAGTAFTALVTVEDVRAQLIEAGAPEDDAKLWAVPIAIVMGALESGGNLPMLHALSPAISGLFRRQIAKELIKRSLPKLIAHKVSRGAVTGLTIEFGEIITENLQAATIEAAQMVWDENQGIFEDVFATTIQTAVATAPFAVIGGGSAMRRAGPSETIGKTDIELETQGLERDAKSGQWFDRANLPEGVGNNKGLLSLTPEQVVGSAAIVESERGRFFHDNPKVAADYVFSVDAEGNRMLKGSVGYVDVPQGIADASNREPRIGALAEEWLIPRENAANVNTIWNQREGVREIVGRAEIDKAIEGLPEVPEGHVRLFRGVLTPEAGIVTPGVPEAIEERVGPVTSEQIPLILEESAKGLFQAASADLTDTQLAEVMRLAVADATQQGKERVGTTELAAAIQAQGVAIPVEAPAVPPAPPLTAEGIQKLIDDKVTELMAGDETDDSFERAEASPEVKALYERRFALDEADVAALIANIKSRVPSNIDAQLVDDVLKNIYSIRPGQLGAYFASEFAVPRLSEREAQRAKAAVAKRLFRDWLQKQGVEESAIRDRDAVAERFAQQAEEVHQAIAEGFAVTKPTAEPLAAALVRPPAVPPTPPVTTPVVEEVAPAPEGAGEQAVQRVKARISFKPRSPGITERLSGVRNRLMAGWINDRAGLDRVISQAQKGGLNVSVEENPAIQAQLLKGVTGKAASFLEQGTFGRKYWRVRGGRTEANITGESLTTILKDVPSNADLENFSTYLVAQRTVELGGRGIGTDEEIADAKLGVTTLEASNPHFPALAERLFAYQDRLLIYSQESGLIDKALLDKFRSVNGKYVPFFRVFEELQDKGFMGKKMANIAVPFKRIRGSERDIINPLESIVKNTFAIISAADRNMVGVQLANLIDQSPEIAEVFERVPTPMAKVAQVSAKSLGIDIEGLSEADIDRVIDIFRPSFAVAGDQVTVLVNGKKQFYRTDPFLRNALLNLNTTPSDMGIIGTILSAPAKWLRAGALLSPDFMVRNPARDQLTAFVYSKYGYLPGIDFTKGVAGMLGTSPEYQLYKISGAEHATLVSVDRDYLSQSFKSVLRQKRVTKYVKTPIELLQIGRDLTETATRLGAAKRAIAAGASGPEVGYTGRNISLDFEKAGSYARVINQYIPFFTAAIRGNAMMIEMFKSNPVRTSLRVFMGITLPSIALYMLNRDEEWYKETPQWQKDLFWLFPPPPGSDTPIRIPKPFELGILFGSTIERFLEYVDTQDISKLTGVAKSVIEAGTPGFMPQVALPIIENLTNFSFFRGQKIVPTSREADPPELQYTQYTSQVSRKLGELLKFSPAKIDNLIAGWTGGLGRYAVDILDGLLKATGISPDIPEPSRTLADTPVVKAFVVRSPIGSSGNTVNEFYDLLEEYTEGEKFLKEMLERGAENRYEDFKGKHPELLFFSDFDRDVFYSASARYLRKVARELAEIRKKEDAVFDDPDMSPAEKRRIIDRMERLKTEVARRALALFPGEDPAVLQHEIAETVNMLGDVVDEVPELSLEEPEIHDTPALSADLGQILVGITPEDLEGMRGIPKEAPAWFEKEESEAEQLSFPNTQIYKINADPSKGTTFELYHEQWQRQQEITDPEELKEWMADHPNASLGNLTKVQLELLREFHAADEETQTEMLDTIPELKVDPRENWLRDNPIDNARLALWGQARIYTREAYDALQRMKKELGWVDRVIPNLVLPPEESLDTHFEYVASLAEGRAWNSWETQLLLLNDNAYREWRGYDPIEDTKWYLETQIKWRDTNETFAEIDPDDLEGRKSFALGNIEWFNDQNRIEANRWHLEEEGFDARAVTAMTEKHVEYSSLLLTNAPNSPEVMLFRSKDKTGLFDWRVEQGEIQSLQEIAGDKGLDVQLVIWDINARNKSFDAQYNSLPTEGDARDDFLASSETYAKERYKRSGLTDGVPMESINKFVEYSLIPERGFRRERYLEKNAEYYNEVYLNDDIQIHSAVDFSKTPNVEYDNLYDKWTDQIVRYHGSVTQVGSIAHEVRLLTGEAQIRKRRQLRNTLFRANRRFFDDNLRWLAHRAFVPTRAIDGYVDYYGVLFEGKPKGAELWYADDRVLRDNPSFFRWAQTNWGWEDRDFDLIPNEQFERAYNEEYAPLRHDDGTANRAARAAYRRKHKDFNAEGVRVFGWQPLSRAPTLGRGGLSSRLRTR